MPEAESLEGCEVGKVAKGYISLTGVLGVRAVSDCKDDCRNDCRNDCGIEGVSGNEGRPERWTFGVLALN